MLRPSSFAHPHSVRASRLQRLRPMASALVLATLAVLPAHQVLAQAFPTWQGTGTNWSTAANWDETFAYGQLEWQGAGNATSWNDLGSQSMWRFYFNGSQAYTLGGGAVSFFDFGGANGGILNDSSVNQTINMNLNFADNGAREMFIFNRSTAGGALTFNGTVALTNSMTYLGIGGTNGSGDITFNGPIVGNKGVVIGTNSFNLNGSGMVGTRVVFNGSNSYTGTTTILRGTLSITNGNSLSTNSVILGLGSLAGIIDAGLTVNGTTTASNNFRFTDAGTNVTLTVTNGASFTITGALANDTGNGATTKFSKAGAGTLILANSASTYAGQIQIGNGTVVIGNSSALGTNITTANRGIDLGLNLRDVSQGNNVVLLLSNGVTLSNSIYVAPNTSSATRTIGVSGSGTATISNQMFLDGTFIADAGAGNTLAIVGNITNTGGITKIGAGTLILGASNNNTGILDISNGVVLLTNTRSIATGSTGSIVRSGAALEMTGNLSAGANATNLTINGSGIATNGAIRSFGSGLNAWNRGVILGSDARIQADAGNTLQISNFANSPTASTFSGTGFNLTVGGDGTTRISANGSTNVIMTGAGGSLTKVGSGTLFLSGSNNYTGATTVSGGTLQFFVGAAVGTNAIQSTNIIINGGSLVLVSGGANNYINTNATLNISSGDLILQNGYSQTLSALDMSGGAVNRGGGNLFFSGLAIVTNGTMLVNNTNGRILFNNGLTVGGANFVYTNANSHSNGAVRISNTVTYGAGNTAPTWFTNADTGSGRLELFGSTAGATNVFNIADAASVTSEVNIAWALVGSAALNKTGNGVLTLAGSEANTYSGNTAVDGGTLILNKTAGVTAVAGNVTVGAGATLLISASEQVANTSVVTLSGGTIERGAGVSETFGDLNLTSNSFLDYGTGAIGTLTFGTYSPAFKLSVNNFLIGNVLRFTTDLSTDINNTSLFTFDSAFSYDWNTTTPGFFTITAVPEPSTVLAAIGLSGLMLWGPVGRRLQRSRK